MLERTILVKEPSTKEKISDYRPEQQENLKWVIIKINKVNGYTNQDSVDS